METCFGVMPFTNEFNEIWTFTVKAAIENSGRIAKRSDDNSLPGAIINQILADIRNADIIIADLTLPNPNVFYEVGFAHALNKPTILICQNLENLPFDLRGNRTIQYSNSILGGEQLFKNLLKVFNSF